MDFKQLAGIVKKLGGVLVMDGDEPQFVVMSFETFYSRQHPAVSGENDQYPHNHNGEPVYENADGANGVQHDGDEETIEKLNQEILALKEEIRQKEAAELSE